MEQGTGVEPALKPLENPLFTGILEKSCAFLCALFKELA